MILNHIRVQKHVAIQATECSVVVFELICEQLVSLQSHVLTDLTFLTVNKSQYVRLNSIRTQSRSPEGGHLDSAGVLSSREGCSLRGFCSHITCLVDEKETTASKNKRENWVSVFFQGPNSLNVWIRSCRHNDTKTGGQRQHNSTRLCLFDMIRENTVWARIKGKNSSWQVKSSVVIFSENITNLLLFSTTAGTWAWYCFYTTVLQA